MASGKQKGREEARVDAPVNVNAVLLDIEHAVVEDDPRTWSSTRKVRTVFLHQWLCFLTLWRSRWSSRLSRARVS